MGEGITRLVEMEVPRFRMPSLSLDSNFFQKATTTKQLSRGDATQIFQKLIADKLGFANAILSANGFSALQLGIETLGLKNAKIVVPAASTCMAIVNSVRASGNSPVYCDLDLGTASLDASKLNELILNEKPSLIISPSHFGIITEYDSHIYKAVQVLEDNAQAFLSDVAYQSQRLSYARIYSFYPTKGLNAIDGGAFVSNDERTMSKCLSISNYDGIRSDDGLVRHNFRMNNVNCAVGLDNMTSLDSSIKRRNEIRDIYANVLGNFEKVSFLNSSRTVLQKFVLRFADENSRNLFNEKMRSHGIGSSSELNYLPTRESKVFSRAKQLTETTCSIPYYETLSDLEVEYVVDKMSKVLKTISD